MSAVSPREYESPGASEMPHRNTVCIAGTPIDRLSRAEAVNKIDSFVKSRRFHQVATANTDFLVNALSDPELTHILRHSDMVTADGMPVVWAARLVGSYIPERVTGADIVPDIASLAAKRGYRLFMLGAQEATLHRAARRLELVAPGIKIVGRLAPPMADLDSLDTPRILAAIRAARPDILLVAFGNPKQEKWIYRNRAALGNVPVCMGVGGTFDFLAGDVRRAPLWMQHCGLEWFHRLALNPRRLWARYSRDFRQFSRAVREERLASARLITPGTQLNLTLTDDDGFEGGVAIHIKAVGPLTAATMRDLNRVAMQAATDFPADSARRITINLAGIGSADAEAAGSLLLLDASLRDMGIDIVLSDTPGALMTLMRLPVDINSPSLPHNAVQSTRLGSNRAGDPIRG